MKEGKRWKQPVTIIFLSLSFSLLSSLSLSRSLSLSLFSFCSSPFTLVLTASPHLSRISNVFFRFFGPILLSLSFLFRAHTYRPQSLHVAHVMYDFIERWNSILRKRSRVKHSVVESLGYPISPDLLLLLPLFILLFIFLRRRERLGRVNCWQRVCAALKSVWYKVKSPLFLSLIALRLPTGRGAHILFEEFQTLVMLKGPS
ncbi:Uncharacterized protein APZ42_025053 [Daphnia magna]|uniref:Uncharacterized protein n=1 Tax=Daphnia magna TaxID=35525 RepID=A0A0P5Y3Z5_9CRUS|nr:Uncharacterized protein APZ42_025053 [Daphnia magna]